MKCRIDEILVANGQEKYDNVGWLYTFVAHYSICNDGFVLGRMDNDTSKYLLLRASSLAKGVE